MVPNEKTIKKILMIIFSLSLPIGFSSILRVQLRPTTFCMFINMNWPFLPINYFWINGPYSQRCWINNYITCFKS
jgi:hypothetical protein